MATYQRYSKILAHNAAGKGGRQLWSFISKFKPHILSAYVEESFDPNCIPGKSHWARTKLGIAPGRINLVKRVQKQNYAKVAGQPAILIDDYPKNTLNSHKGGIGIHHTSTKHYQRTQKTRFLVSFLINIHIYNKLSTLTI